MTDKAADAVATVLRGATERWAVYVVGHDLGMPEGPIGSGAARVGALLRQVDREAPVAKAWLEAAEAIADARWAAADDALSRAEEVDLVAAQTEFAHGASRLARAHFSRRVRARVADAGGDLKTAARHYATALRCLPLRDAAGRSAINLLQISALARHALAAGDRDALADAASRAYAILKDCSHEQIGGIWIETHIQLAGMLAWLGEIEHSRKHVELAAVHAGAALDAAELGGDGHVPATAPTRARRLQNDLARALIDWREAAADAMPEPDDASDQLLALAVVADPPATADETEHAALEAKASRLEAQLAAGADTLEPIEAGRLGDALADIYWRLGALDRDPARLTSATQTKLAALDAFEAANATQLAEATRASLARLADDLMKTSMPLRLASSKT